MFKPLHPVKVDKLRNMGGKFTYALTLYKYGNTIIREIPVKWKRYALINVKNIKFSAVTSHLLQGKYGNWGYLQDPKTCNCRLKSQINEVTEHLLLPPSPEIVVPK